MEKLIETFNCKSIEVVNEHHLQWNFTQILPIEVRIVVGRKELKILLNTFQISNNINIDSMVLLNVFQITYTRESWVVILVCNTPNKIQSVLQETFATLISITGKVQIIISNLVSHLPYKFKVERDFHHYLCGSLVTFDTYEHPHEEEELAYQQIVKYMCTPFPEFNELICQLPFAMAPRTNYLLNQCQGTQQGPVKVINRLPNENINNFQNTITTVHLSLPRKTIARLIGRNGCHIREIRSKSKAEILIHDENTLQTPIFQPTKITQISPNIPLQNIIVKGNSLEVQRAIWLLSNYWLSK